MRRPWPSHESRVSRQPGGSDPRVDDTASAARAAVLLPQEHIPLCFHYTTAATLVKYPRKKFFTLRKAENNLRPFKYRQASGNRHQAIGIRHQASDTACKVCKERNTVSRSRTCTKTFTFFALRFNTWKSLQACSMFCTRVNGGPIRISKEQWSGV